MDRSIAPASDDEGDADEEHTCRTATFVSAMDCEIFEHGAAFELVDLPEETSLGTGVTSPNGDLHLARPREDTYRLEEHGSEPCHVEPSSVVPDGTQV